MDLTGPSGPPTSAAPVPEIPGVPVRLDGAAETGPDGRPWVKLTITLGLGQHVLVIPEATARELATLIPDVLTQAADGARRARLGLIVPGVGNGNTGPVQLTPEQVTAMRNGSR